MSNQFEAESEAVNSRSGGARSDGGAALAERFLEFSVAVISIVSRLPKNEIGSHVAKQLLRSGTSPGANYEEARGAESRGDFCHKLGIVLKETKESRYWLKLIVRSNLLAPERVQPVIEEAEQLCAIAARSISTARSRR